MAEWSNAAVLKTVDPSRGPGVRIPLSPQRKKQRAEEHFNLLLFFSGEMPERSNGAVSKTVDPFWGPGVRIPLSPQNIAGTTCKKSSPGRGCKKLINSRVFNFSWACQEKICIS